MTDGWVQGSGASRVDINRASVDSLRDDVDGIGQVLAERIVAYRQEHGPFATVDDLVRIRGIGATTLRSMADQLTVTGATAPTERGAALAEEVIDMSEDLYTPDEEQEDAGASEESEPMGLDEEPPAEEGVATTAFQLVAGDDEAPSAEPPTEEEVDEDADEDVEDAEMEQELGQYMTEEEAELPAEEEEEAADADAEAVAELVEEPMGSPVTVAAVSADALPRPSFALPAQAEEEPEAAAAPEVESEPEPIVSAPVAAPVERSASVAAEPRIIKTGIGFWQGLLLVLLGGVLGLAATLIVLSVTSGTLSFAPSAQVDALDRNIGVIQANSEVAWQRADRLTTRIEDVEAAVTTLQSLRGQLTVVEGELAQLKVDTGEAQKQAEKAATDLATLSDSVDASMADFDGRVSDAEQSVDALNASVAAVSESVTEMETQVGVMDGFFSSLRDLLIDMQGLPESQPAE